MRATALAFVFGIACALSALAAQPPVKTEQAALRAEVIDAASRRVKAEFITRTPIVKTPERRTFAHERSITLPRPVGRVAIDAQVQFLGFSKKEVWFAINTNAASDGKGSAVARRVIKATASVPYGQSLKIDDLFSADGHRLSLVIHAMRETETKATPFSLRRFISELFQG